MRDDLDIGRFRRWWGSTSVADGLPEGLSTIRGGSQNVLVRFHDSGGTYVLRHPPRHKGAAGDLTMRRESRVLRALAQTDIPHPRFVAFCDDPDVLGVSFFVMRHVEGFSPDGELPDPHRGDALMQRRFGLNIAGAAGALATVDYEAVGLADFGRPAGFLDRQVPRWLHQFESYAAFSGYDQPSLPGIASLAGWLERYRPPGRVPAILHGDFHAGNVLISPTGPEVAAIVDWELATIGDPLLDLAWFLVTWPAGGPSAATVQTQPWDGLAGRDDIAAAYAAAGGGDVSDLEWYEVLACFKLGVILEGTFARACAGLVPREVGDKLHRGALALFEQALDTVKIRR